MHAVHLSIVVFTGNSAVSDGMVITVVATLTASGLSALAAKPKSCSDNAATVQEGHSFHLEPASKTVQLCQKPDQCIRC